MTTRSIIVGTLALLLACNGALAVNDIAAAEEAVFVEKGNAHRPSVTATTQWSEPRFQEDLVDPVCTAGLTRYEHKGKSLLLFTNHDVLKGHRNITVRVSEDEGRTWPIFRSIEPGWSAYSDVTVTQSGTILCFYGRSRKANFADDRLTVAQFTLD